MSTVDAVEEAVIARILSFFQDGPATLAAEITAWGRVVPEMFRKGRPHEVSVWLAHGLLG
ncbi:hypothetical protein [Streptomyces sp. NPDC046870]|uniref:hypothetical protein n=1 Tax=Streptomyces sp. NPDC046870 TaxID=3155135 RepID=UPI0034517CE9